MDPAQFWRQAFGQDGNTPAAALPPSALRLAAAEVQSQKSTPRERVDAWRAAPKGTLSRDTIKKECTALAFQENWEMAVYALELLDSCCDKLVDNVRLLWIVQENFHILFLLGVSKLDDFVNINNFGILPPISTYGKFDRVYQALKEVNPGANKNLAIIKKSLFCWEVYFLQLQQFMGTSTLTSRLNPPPRLTPLPLTKFISEIHDKNQPIVIKMGEFSCLLWAISSHECCFDPLFTHLAERTSLARIQAVGYGEHLQFSLLSLEAQLEFSQPVITEFFTQKIQEAKARLGDQLSDMKDLQELSEQAAITDEDYAGVAATCQVNPAIPTLVNNLLLRLTPAQRQQFMDGWILYSEDLVAFKNYLRNFFTAAEAEQIAEILK